MSIGNLNTGTILSQILILFVLIAIGYISGKTGYLPEKTGMITSKLIMRITMPALILSKMLSANFSRENYYDGITLICLAVGFLLLIYFFTLPFTKITKLQEASRNVYSMQTMFGNVIFFAFPLFQALFGDIGVIYALFFNVGNDLLLWTLGVYLAGKHKSKGAGSGLVHILNANMIMFIIGIVLVVTNLHTKIQNTIIPETANIIGQATSPLSMIFIGLVLAESKGFFKNMGKKLLVVIMSFQKLVIAPVIIGALLLLAVRQGWISDSVMVIAVMQLAMPIGTLTVSIAAEYGSDYEMAAEGVFVSTLLSIVTLPLMAYFLRLVL